MILYVKGNINCLHKDCIAVIGTRKPTENGRKFGVRIAGKLAKLGLTVVSGLAVGCDGAAHEGCLEEEGLPKFVR